MRRCTSARPIRAVIGPVLWTSPCWWATHERSPGSARGPDAGCSCRALMVSVPQSSLRRANWILQAGSLSCRAMRMRKPSVTRPTRWRLAVERCRRLRPARRARTGPSWSACRHRASQTPFGNSTTLAIAVSNCVVDSLPAAGQLKIARVSTDVGRGHSQRRCHDCSRVPCPELENRTGSRFGFHDVSGMAAMVALRLSP